MKKLNWLELIYSLTGIIFGISAITWAQKGYEVLAGCSFIVFALFYLIATLERISMRKQGK